VPTTRPTIAPTLPSSGQVVPAGEYTWTGFQPSIVIVIDAPVWQVGHRHAEYFDLFPATVSSGAGPGVGAGRFDAVYGAEGPVAMSTGAAVVAALRSNPGIAVKELGPASPRGRTGLEVDLTVAAPQTAVFDGLSGTFHLDPGWTARFWFLDVDGGVLLVSVIDRDDHFETGLALAQPILDGLRVAP
jgi:hypothetical protein